MIEILNKYLSDINIIFKELISHLTIFEIGNDNINSLNDNVNVSPIISAELKLEPISVTELKRSKKKYPDFIMDVYHNKLAIEWQNLLDDVYAYRLNQHFSKQKTFKELGKSKVKVDFLSEIEIVQQIKGNLKLDFSFLPYKDRIRVINNSFECIDKNEDVLKKILKNILIRNSLQHKNKKLDNDFLNQMGSNTLTLLNQKGEEKRYVSGDEIFIYLPEIFEFKKAMIQLIIKWSNDGQI